MRKIQFRSSFNAFLHYQLLTRPVICLESMFAHLKMDFICSTNDFHILLAGVLNTPLIVGVSF